MVNSPPSDLHELFDKVFQDGLGAISELAVSLLDNLVTLGTLDSCNVHSREVFRPAICAPGSAVILRHNHPSSDPTPSEADIRVTRDLIRAGQLLKIDVLDHVVIGEVAPDRPKAWFSLRGGGYFF